MSKLKNYGKLNVPDFVWWVGIVESRADITKTGRYRVRIFGYHTSNTEDLPVKDLPYAPVINSVTTAGTSGIGETPNLLPGSTVIGFFSDGDEAQMPVILGSIAGLPAEKNEDLTVEDGFNDPNKKYPRGGFDEPKPEGFAGVGEPDLSRLARDAAAEEHFSLQRKRAEREVDIRTAAAPSVQTDEILDDKEGIDYEGQKWEEPYARGKGPYNTFKMEEFTPKYWDAKADMESGGDGIPKEPGTYTSMYPFNLVKETETGFTTETDNTAGNERYAWYHPVGNYEEVQADGTRVNRIKGSDYEIVAKDKNVLIRGSCNITVLGDAKMLVTGNKYEEVEGDYFLTVLGDRVTKINGNDVKSVITDENTTIKGMRTVRVALDDNETIIGSQTESVGKFKTETVVGNVTETFNANHNTFVTKQSFLRAGTTYAHQAGGIMTLASGGNQTFVTSKNQKLEVGQAQDMVVAQAQTITATGHSTFNNNVTITGTTHSVGDVSTDAGNAPTLATHKHKYNPGGNPPTDASVPDA